MKLIKLHRNLVFSLAILCTFPTFAQWQKQNLPVTQGFPHMQVSGSTAGKNVLWLPTVDALPDSTRVNPIEFVRTADGGKTYQKGIILPNNKEYYYVLHPFDATTAYLSAF